MSERVAPAELIDDQGRLREFIERAASADRIALDTEFHREKTYFPKLALVQIAVGSETVLIDPLAVDITPLAALFGPDHLVVMHACRQDLEVLEQVCGTVPARIVDTQIVAGFIGYSSASLSSLLERELGVSIPKADRLTDWLRRPLSDRQKTYAASDVDRLLDLYDSLDRKLSEVGRTAWCADATAELLAEARGPRDPDEAWRRIKEVGHLRGQDLATAQHLAAWRERRAAALDVTQRFVISDLGLVGVAVARPTDAAGLSALRGVDGGSLRSVAEEIFAVIEGSIGAEPVRNRGSRRDDLPSSLRPAVALATAWLGQLAKDLSIEPAILATRADIEAFLRGDGENRLGRGWRAEVVGAPLRGLVEGRVALAFDRAKGLILEPRDHDGG